MDLLRIALLQIAPCSTLKENLDKGVRHCMEAKERGADIALFPEMWSNGYNIYGRPVSEWQAEAIRHCLSVPEKRPSGVSKSKKCKKMEKST